MEKGKKEEIIIFLSFFFFFFFPRKPDLASFRVMIRVARNKKLADSWPICEQGREKGEGGS